MRLILRVVVMEMNCSLLVLARISHQLTAADADLPIFAALNTA